MINSGFVAGGCSWLSGILDWLSFMNRKRGVDTVLRNIHGSKMRLICL